MFLSKTYFFFLTHHTCSYPSIHVSGPHPHPAQSPRRATSLPACAALFSSPCGVVHSSGRLSLSPLLASTEPLCPQIKQGDEIGVPRSGTTKQLDTPTDADATTVPGTCCSGPPPNARLSPPCTLRRGTRHTLSSSSSDPPPQLHLPGCSGAGAPGIGSGQYQTSALARSDRSSSPSGASATAFSDDPPLGNSRIGTAWRRRTAARCLGPSAAVTSSNASASMHLVAASCSDE